MAYITFETQKPNVELIVEMADENQLDPEATISVPLGGDILAGGNS